MNKIEAFILDLPPVQAELVEFLHQLMLTFPEVTSKIRYKIPFYYHKSWICYINPIKKEAVEFVFTRGNELSNEQGLLETKGRKQVRGVTFTKVDDIPMETLVEVIQEALLLDETTPYASKRTKA